MLNPPLLLNLRLMLNPKLGTDITMVDTMDILMDTTILERDLLRLNLKLPQKLPQKLKPNPGMDTMVMWTLWISLWILQISPCLLWSLLVVISCNSQRSCHFLTPPLRFL